MNQKVLAELYKSSILEYIFYIIIGVVIGLPFGILIGHLALKP
jgi:ABC-type antimicrobial peptide transport system permease subunit